MSKQFKDELKKWQKVHQKKKPKKRKEQLTEEDIRELMGVYRPTYRRKRGGAFKQK